MDNPQEERRRYVRIEKHFIISYHAKDDPTAHYEISQLKNISLGGMCFIAQRAYSTSTVISIELKTPYISEATHVEGVVLESKEKIPGMIYETRLSFTELSEEGKFVLAKIVEIFSKLKK